MAHAKGYEVRQYMRAVLDDHREAQTGEVAATLLAEDAAAHFDWYERDDVPEVFFEWAVNIAEADRIARSGDVPRWMGGLVAAYDHKCGRG